MTRTQRVSTFQAKRDEANSIAKEILNDYRLQRQTTLLVFRRQYQVSTDQLVLRVKIILVLLW